MAASSLGEAILKIKILVEGARRLNTLPASMDKVGVSAQKLYDDIQLIKVGLANFLDAKAIFEKVAASVTLLNRAFKITVNRLVAILKLTRQINAARKQAKDDQKERDTVKQSGRRRDAPFKPRDASNFGSIIDAAKKLDTATRTPFLNVRKGVIQIHRAIREFSKGNASAGIANLGNAFRRLSGTIGNAASQIGNGLKSIGGVITSFGSSLRQAGFILRDAGIQLLAYGAILSGFFVVFASDAAKYEQAVADFSSVINGLQDGSAETQLKIEALSDQILKLAETTKFTAIEIAAAAEVLGLAGFSFQEVSESIAGVARLAAATGSSIKDAADLQASILRSFSLSAKSADEVADILTATVTNANTDITKLKESFKIASPAAAAFGQSVQQTAAALGVLANSGLRSSIAGTGLSRILTQLVENADLADETLRRLGSTFADIDPRKNNLSQIVKEFERIGTSAETLGQLFDQRAFRSLQALINQGSATFDALLSQIENATGLARSIERIKLNTLIGDVTILNSAVKSLSITLGKILLAPSREVIQALTDIVTGMTAFVSQSQGIVSSISKVGIAFGATLTTIGAFTFGMGSLAAAAVPVVLVIGSLVTGIGSLAGAITLVTTLFASFSGILAPIAAAAGTLIAIASVVTIAIVASIGVVIAALSAFAVAMAGAFSTALVNDVGFATESIGAILKSIAGIIQKTVIPAFKMFQLAVYALVVPAFREFSRELQLLFAEFSKASGELTPGFESLGYTVAETFTNMIRFATEMIKMVRGNKDNIIEFFKNMMSALKVLITVLPRMGVHIAGIAASLAGLSLSILGVQDAFLLLGLGLLSGGIIPFGILVARAIKEWTSAAEDSGDATDEVFEKYDKYIKKLSDFREAVSDTAQEFNKGLELFLNLPSLNKTQSEELKSQINSGKFDRASMEADIKAVQTKIKETEAKLLKAKKLGDIVGTTELTSELASLTGLSDKLKVAANSYDEFYNTIKQGAATVKSSRDSLANEATELSNFQAKLLKARRALLRDGNNSAIKGLVASSPNLATLLGITPESGAEDIDKAVSKAAELAKDKLIQSDALNKILPNADEIASIISDGVSKGFTKNSIIKLVATYIGDQAGASDALAKAMDAADKSFEEFTNSQQKGASAISAYNAAIDAQRKAIVELNKERANTVAQGGSTLDVDARIKDRVDNEAAIQDAIDKFRADRDKDIAADTLARRRELLEDIEDEEMKYQEERILVILESQQRLNEELKDLEEKFRDEADLDLIKRAKANATAQLDAILLGDLAKLKEEREKAISDKNDELTKEDKLVESITDKLASQVASIATANQLLAFRNKIQEQADNRAERSLRRLNNLNDQKNKELAKGPNANMQKVARLNQNLQIAEANAEFDANRAGKKFKPLAKNAQAQAKAVGDSLLLPNFVEELGRVWAEAIAKSLKIKLAGMTINLKVGPGAAPNIKGGNQPGQGSIVNDNRTFNIIVDDSADIFPIINPYI